MYSSKFSPSVVQPSTFFHSLSPLNSSSVLNVDGKLSLIHEPDLVNYKVSDFSLSSLLAANVPLSEASPLAPDSIQLSNLVNDL